MVDCEASLVHHLFEIAVAERIAQIPADTEQDDLTRITTPFERVRFAHE